MAREQHGLVTGLVDAGIALRAAMEEALGGDRSAMREAQVAERRASDAVIGAGAGYLERAGPARRRCRPERTVSTLRAAVVDPSAAGLLRAGILDADLDAPGFGLDALSADATKTGETGATVRQAAAAVRQVLSADTVAAG